MLSIQATVYEMDQIKKEMVLNSKRNKELRDKYKKLENDVLNYCEVHDEIGVKYRNLAVYVESKPKRESKKAKEAEKDQLNILEEYGIEGEEAVQILKKISDAKKGDEIENKKVRIKPVSALEKKK